MLHRLVGRDAQAPHPRRPARWLVILPMAIGLPLAIGLGCTGNVIDPESNLRGPAGPTAPGGKGGSGGNRPPGNTTPPGSTTPPGGNPPPGMTDPGPVGAPPTSSAIPACQGEETPGPRRLRLLTRLEYANSVVDLLGIPLPSTDNLPVETVVDGFDNNAKAAAITSRHVDEYLATAERVSVEGIKVSRWKLATCPAGPGCDKTFITTFGQKVFRRPLATDEIERYSKLFDPAVTGGVFEKGMELVVRAMFSSPNFLYRTEMGEKQADGTFKLTGYELASALSFFLWNSTPDDQLLAAAKAGALDTPAGLEMHATRLINDRRSRPAVATFFRQWLGTDGLLFTNKDANIYPAFTEAVRKGMLEEQDAFVNHVVFEGTGKYPELHTANYVFVNPTLAQFYGLAPAGGATQKTMLPAAGASRGGLLALGAVMGMHAHSNESSPVRRGLFIRSRMLCQTLPLPPADVDTTPPGLDPSLTTRARFDRHSSDPKCQGCHKLIDPVGYGFERYDGIGAYREKEGTHDVDASGYVLGLEELGNDVKTPFAGPIELGKILAGSPNAQACFARQLFRYARGGENGSADGCAISKLQAVFKESGFDMRRLLLEVVRGKSFLTRG